MNTENHNTEYKRIWKDEYLKWVSGFANAQGGKINIDILKRPEFIVEQGGVAAIINREIFMSIRGDKAPNQTEPKPIQTDTKTIQKNAILDLIRVNSAISMDDISSTLYLTKSSVQRRLEALVKENRIRHVGPTNGGHWEIIT